MKKVLIVSISLLVFLLAGVITVIYPSSMRGIVPTGIDMSGVADGSYAGSFVHGRFTNTLTVHVENGAITRIDVVEDVLAAFITNASEEVFRRVIVMQDTKIDAVAGATITTNAYLKAIENALSANSEGS